MSITPKVIQDLLRRLECSAEAPLGSYRGWKRCDSATAKSDVEMTSVLAKALPVAKQSSQYRLLVIELHSGSDPI